MARPLWLIDLDNTLVDASWRVMGEINRRMTAFMAERLAMSEHAATRLRQVYWHRYGATLLGLIRHHGVDPDEFLLRTHPMQELPQMVRRIPGAGHRIGRLNGERWLLTNAPRAYAHKMLRLLGLHRRFDRVIAIEDMRICGRLRPKPSVLLMRSVLRQSGRPARAVRLIDDHGENLQAAHRLGMRTARIWTSKTALRQARHSGRPLAVRRPSYVRVQVNCVAHLLRVQHLHSTTA